MQKVQAKDGRGRVWATVVYPDSAPDNWINNLQDIHAEILVSPLHDRDINPDGQPKKAHWHVMMMFCGKKSAAQIKAITDKLNAPKAQLVGDRRGYARYLCHLDNPEKAQYQVDQVRCMGGADYLTYIERVADVDSAVGEMMDWCDEQGIYSFAQLARYARGNRPDWFRVLTSQRSYFMSQYCKSKHWEEISQQ